MKITILGCSAVELPNARLSSFLIDENLLLDAGAIGTALDESRQNKIKYILLTHAHFDHIKDLPFFADDIGLNNEKRHVTVMSIPEVINALEKHVFNNVVWPDFTKLPDPEGPIIKLESIDTDISFGVDGYMVTAYEVNHTVPAVAYVIEDKKGKRLLYMGDSGPNETTWNAFNETEKQIHGAIIGVSLPNRYKDKALLTGHLTPELLKIELDKMKNLPRTIYITHAKPMYKETVREELLKLKISNMKILNDGDIYEI
jgi:cAMP phosphodiesterase